jgi:nitrite reductase/ring-hydroxylating ferredoxin subunit
MKTTPWVDACASDEIPRGSAKLVRIEGSAIALWRTAAGELHAVDNRCPHEGYPLVKGELRDCVLTCNWHNYKFDLRDGGCLVGEEGVRVFPLSEEEGRVWIDPTPPDPALEREKLQRSLVDGAIEGDLGRVARDLARLMELDVAPTRLLQEAAALDADHGKYGVTHVLAVAADLRAWLLHYPERHPLVPILHAYELFAEGNRRRPRRPAVVAPPTLPGASVGTLRERFLEAVEAENLDSAAELLAAALAQFSFDVICDWLLLAGASHFLSFGHPLIYAAKLREIASDAPAELRARMAQGLLRNIVSSTREDQLPPMKATRAWLVDNRAAREAWASTQVAAGGNKLEAHEHDALVEEILAGTPAGVCAALDAHLAAGATAETLCDALVHAAAERLWRFDPAIADDIETQDDWLYVSHPFTFAHAVREAIARLPHGITLGALYHAAHFIQRAKKLDGGFAKTPGVSVGPAFDANALRRSLREGKVDTVLEGAAPWILDPTNHGDLRAVVESLALEDVATRPIYIAHVLKTARVAFDEAAILPEAAARTCLFALLRFLATPKNERGLRQLAHDARGLVENGRLPRLLSA